MVYSVPCKLATLSMLESHVSKAVNVFEKTKAIQSLKAVDHGIKDTIHSLISGHAPNHQVKQVMLRTYAEQLDQFLLDIDTEKPANTQQGVEMFNKLVDVTKELETFTF